ALPEQGGGALQIGNHLNVRPIAQGLGQYGGSGPRIEEDGVAILEEGEGPARNCQLFGPAALDSQLERLFRDLAANRRTTMDAPDLPLALQFDEIAPHGFT